MTRRSFLKSLLLAPLALVATKVLPKEKDTVVAEAVSDNIKTGESVAIADKVTDFTSQTWTPSDINNPNFGVYVPQGASVASARHTFYFAVGNRVFFADGERTIEMFT